MKAEEIRQKVTEAFKLHANKADCDSMFLPADIEQRVTDMVRSLILQALEEAAVIADGWDSASNGNHACQVAIDIRSLKDEIQEK